MAEQHLAKVVHGLEDVLYGVDPACLCEEGERGTTCRQGARIQPGVHRESCLLFPGLVQHGHSLVFHRIIEWFGLEGTLNII